MTFASASGARSPRTSVQIAAASRQLARRGRRRAARIGARGLRLPTRALSGPVMAAHAGSWRYDVGSRLIAWDDRAAAIYGLPLREFDGTFETWIQRVDLEDRDLVQAAFEDGLRHREPFEVVHRSVARDGTVRWVEARGRPVVRRHQAVGTEGLLLDVTDRVTAGSQLNPASLDDGQQVHSAEGLFATLQALLLPAPLVDDGAWRVHYRYSTGERRLLLGGDFLDVVELDDGSLAFVIGDVVGHGPRAAAAAIALRAAWRCETLSGARPADALEAMERLLATETDDPEFFATACSGNVSDDGRSLLLASAGHLPPLLVADDEAIPITVPSRPPLGLGEGVNLTPVALPPQWALLLHTDGLVEGRSGSIGDNERYGNARLRTWLEQRPRQLDGSDLDALLATVEQANGGRMNDDVTMLSIRPAEGTRRPRLQYQARDAATDLTDHGSADWGAARRVGPSPVLTAGAPV